MPTTVAELFFWLLGLTGFGLFALLAWSLRNVLSNLIKSIDLLRTDIKELFNDNTALRKEIADLKINCARQHGTGRRKAV